MTVFAHEFLKSKYMKLSVIKDGKSRILTKQCEFQTFC